MNDLNVYSAGPLTPEQLRQYERDGFLVLPGYLDAATVAELARGAEEVARCVGPIQPRTPRLQVDLIDNQYRLRMIEPVVDLGEPFARLAADERVTGLFESLFNEPPVLFEDKLNYKHPRGGTPFPMHQDYPYWQRYTPRLVSALIYIDAATEANGCLEVVPGWHRKGILANGPVKVGLMTDSHVCTDSIDPSLVVKVPGPPGTMILFSCFTPHASAPNLSDRPRRAIVLTYNPASAGDSYEERYGAVRRKGVSAS
jgi:ectoine hydroxylase-related dioxygenase (phytanoyl-CoA dioxygenase family)